MNGLYGSAVPPAGEWAKATDTATPAGKIRTVTVGVCNTTDYPERIYIAFSTAATGSGVQLKDWKTPGITLNPRGEYERTHQVVGAGENVFVKSDNGGVAFDVRGYEGTA